MLQDTSQNGCARPRAPSPHHHRGADDRATPAADGAHGAHGAMLADAGRKASYPLRSIAAMGRPDRALWGRNPGLHEASFPDSAALGESQILRCARDDQRDRRESLFGTTEGSPFSGRPKGVPFRDDRRESLFGTTEGSPAEKSPRDDEGGALYPAARCRVVIANGDQRWSSMRTRVTISPLSSGTERLLPAGNQANRKPHGSPCVGLAKRQGPGE